VVVNDVVIVDGSVDVADGGCDGIVSSDVAALAVKERLVTGAVRAVEGRPRSVWLSHRRWNAR
jgi:hypothetical protein